MRRLPMLGGSVAVAVPLLLTAGPTATATVSATATAVFHHPRIPARPVHHAGWSASNWSGYAKTGSYSTATARWIVPSVSATKSASYSSQWVGIDGFNNSDLIQTGTEADYYNRAAHYNAWWEILPAAETPITTMTIRPGDVMTATITKGTGSSWTISISDTTTGKSFTTTQSYAGPGASVEWVEEAPTVGGRVATLAHYSSPNTFDPGTANGRNPGLTANDAGVMIQKRTQVSTPSAPDSDTDGFNMAYGATAPASPGT